MNVVRTKFELRLSRIRCLVFSLCQRQGWLSCPQEGQSIRTTCWSFFSYERTILDEAKPHSMTKNKHSLACCPLVSQRPRKMIKQQYQVWD